MEVVRDESDAEPLLGKTLHELQHLLGLATAALVPLILELLDRGLAAK